MPSAARLSGVRIPCLPVLDAVGLGTLIVGGPRSTSAALEFFREAATDVDRPLVQRSHQLLKPPRRHSRNVVFHPWKLWHRRHLRNMTIQIFIQAADYLGWSSGTDSVWWKGLGN